MSQGVVVSRHRPDSVLRLSMGHWQAMTRLSVRLASRLTLCAGCKRGLELRATTDSTQNADSWTAMEHH